MEAVTLGHSAWSTTFPHPVTPLPDEWLAGVLLRCDEANYWSSGTTFGYVLRSTHHPGFGPGSPLVVVPFSLLECLAQLFQVPPHLLLATTYQAELLRLYPHRGSYREARRLTGTQKATWVFSMSATRREKRTPTNTFGFHVCPVCLTQQRMLRHSLLLPYLKYCPLHHVAFQTRCQCGCPLLLFHPETIPFTCHICGLNWRYLPQIPISSDHLASEHNLYALYELFLRQGTPELLGRALGMARRLVKKRQEMMGMVSRPRIGGSSLAYVVKLLVSIGLTPSDILADEK